MRKLAALRRLLVDVVLHSTEDELTIAEVIAFEPFSLCLQRSDLLCGDGSARASFCEASSLYCTYGSF